MTSPTAQRNRNPAVPRVSVLIANRDYARYLDRAVTSALEQTRAAHEVLVFDDASEDHSLDVIGRYDVVCLRGDGRGVAAARNALIERATGTHLLLLDADDWLDPDAIEVFEATLAAHPGSEATYGEFRIHRESPDVPLPRIGRRTPPVLAIDSCYRVLHYIPCHTLVFPRAWAVPFDESLSTSEDQAFWTEVLLRGGRFHHIDRPVATYRVHGASRSAKRPLESLSNQLAIHDALMRRFPEARRHASYLRHVRWRRYKYGLALLRAGRRAEGLRELAESVGRPSEAPSRAAAGLLGLVSPAALRLATHVADRLGGGR